MFTKLKKKIEEENQTELVIGIPPPPPQLPAPTPTHSRRASDCGVSTPGRSTCSEASDSDREQKPKKLSQGNTAENDNSKPKGSTPKRSAPTGADYEEIYHKLQLIKKEKQELERQLRESEQRVELLAGRCENREEIESFQSQEMAKVKHLLLCSQQELRAADERLRQRSQELQQARDRAAELEKALSEGGEQARARDLERDKTALEAEVDRLKQDALQNATRISQLECELGGLTDEHDGLKHTHDVYKSKATTLIDEKDRHITDLEDKVRTLEKRLEGTALTGDEHIQSLVDEGNGDSRQLIGACCNFVSTFVADRIKMAWDPLQSDPGSPLHEGDDRAVYVAHEKGGATVPSETAKRCRRIAQLRAIRRRLRHCHYKTKSYTEVPKRAGRRQLRRKELEKKLDESRQHLSEVKTSWSDKINNLEAQIFNLNQKMAEDSQECSRMEKLLAEAQQRLKDQQQQCAKLEEQLLARDTEVANMRRSHEEELQRQRALQDSQLDELRMQAADLRAQLTQAQRDRDRETSQAQARIVELNKKEAECRKSQERIQGLEASQQTSLEKVSKLERQLSLVSHSETTLKHSLKRSEAELKTVKEDLAKLKQDLASAKTENKQLTEELEAKQQQANEQRARLEEEVAQLQESLRSVTEKVEQLEKEAAANESNSTSLADLESKVADLEDQVSEKNKMLKLQQQRISDMKKTLQKELKSHQGASAAAAVLNIEGVPSAASDVPSPPVDHSSGLGSAGDSVVRAGTQEAGLATQPRGPDNKLEDDINFKYLKHVVFKFMTSKEYEAQHLIRAVSVLLRFTADEEQMIREHLDWKNSWFGTRPQPHHPPLHPLPQHHHGHNSHHHHHRSSAAFTNHPKGNTKTT